LADSEGGTAEAAQMYLLHYAGYSVEDFAPIYLRRSEDCGFSEFLKLDPDFRVPMRRTEAGAKDEHKYKYVYVAQEMARAIGGGAVIPAASGRRLLRRQDMWVAFGETALALPEGKKESLAWLAELGIMEAKTEPNRPEYRPRWQEADLEKLTEIGVKARQRLGAQAPRPKGGKEEK
jgi:hypothetical protein